MIVHRNRDTLGRLVRDAWIKWARTHPSPKPSWLVPYDALPESDQEADRQIGEFIYNLREADLDYLKKACSKENEEISQILGSALGFPRFCDDLKSFPEATEKDGVCVGDHVTVTLAMLASDRIRALESRNDSESLAKTTFTLDLFDDPSVQEKSKFLNYVQILYDDSRNEREADLWFGFVDNHMVPGYSYEFTVKKVPLKTGTTNV